MLYFTIRYRLVNITGSPSDWVQVPARIPPNVRFYRLTGLQPGTDYEIVVRAHNAQGPSLPSKPLEESTLEEGEGRVDIPGRVLTRSICQMEGGGVRHVGQRVTTHGFADCTLCGFSNFRHLSNSPYPTYSLAKTIEQKLRLSTGDKLILTCLGIIDLHCQQFIASKCTFLFNVYRGPPCLMLATQHSCLVVF